MLFVRIITVFLHGTITVDLYDIWFYYGFETFRGVEITDVQCFNHNS